MSRAGTAYSEEVAAQILAHVESGETISSIARMDGMPSRNTLRKWTRGEGAGVGEDFPDRFEKALRARLEGFVDDLLQIPRDADPNHPGQLQRAKLECENRRWLLSKMIPEHFGDRSQVELAGQLGATMMEELEQLRREKQESLEANERLTKHMSEEDQRTLREIARRQITRGDRDIGERPGQLAADP